MPRGSKGPELVVIYWRDIPAQVNAQLGRERHQVLLPDKFQRAVDRAKRKAHIYTAHEDIAQWRRESQPCEGDLEAAARLRWGVGSRVEYTRDRLGLLAVRRWLGGGCRYRSRARRELAPSKSAKRRRRVEDADASEQDATRREQS